MPWKPHGDGCESLGRLRIPALTSKVPTQRAVPLLLRVSECFSASSLRSGNSQSQVGASTSPRSTKPFQKGSSLLTFPPVRHEDTGDHTDSQTDPSLPPAVAEQGVKLDFTVVLLGISF